MKENILIDFLLENPMEMREFMESHQKLNFIKKYIIKFFAYWKF